MCKYFLEHNLIDIIFINGVDLCIFNGAAILIEQDGKTCRGSVRGKNAKLEIRFMLTPFLTFWCFQANGRVSFFENAPQAKNQ